MLWPLQALTTQEVNTPYPPYNYALKTSRLSRKEPLHANKKIQPNLKVEFIEVAPIP